MKYLDTKNLYGKDKHLHTTIFEKCNITDTIEIPSPIPLRREVSISERGF